MINFLDLPKNSKIIQELFIIIKTLKTPLTESFAKAIEGDKKIREKRKRRNKKFNKSDEEIKEKNILFIINTLKIGRTIKQNIISIKKMILKFDNEVKMIENMHYYHLLILISFIF